MMDDKIENIDKIVRHWLDSADKNQKTMNHLVDSKDYSWAYKQEFYQLCTQEFTDVWLDRIEKIRLWLRNQL